MGCDPGVVLGGCCFFDRGFGGLPLSAICGRRVAALQMMGCRPGVVLGCFSITQNASGEGFRQLLF